MHQPLNRKISPLFSIAIIIILLGASACVPIVSLDNTIHLMQNEKWEVEVLVGFFARDIPFNQGTIEQTLDQTVASLNSQGVQASWKRDDSRGASGSAVYVITSSGVGLDALGRKIFQQPGAFVLQEQDGKKIIAISLEPQSGLGGVQTIRYTIRGGNIQSTNGTPFDSTTVYWINPSGRMNVVMDSPEGMQLTSILLIGGGLILIAVAALGLTHFLRKIPAAEPEQVYYPPQLVSPGMVICEHCQHEIPENAHFCPHCGYLRS